MTQRTYKFRFYPDAEQHELLTRTFGCVRFVYNAILRYRTDAYCRDGESVGYTAANARLSEMKRDDSLPWLREVSSVPLQQCLRHQQRAFRNFFEGRARHPRFKSKHHRQSAEFTRSAFSYQDGELRIAKCSTPLDVCWSRPPSSAPTTVTVTMDAAGRYFVSLLCEFEPKRLPVSPRAVGIDMGLTHLAILSTGEKITNARHTATYAEKLARAQRKLARCKKGSANRKKAKRRVARLHARMADRRLDRLHKLSRRLVDENQVVCVETLNVRGMVRNHSLAKSISDAAWGELVRQLRYKAAWAGRTLLEIDRFYPSSRRCHDCGHVAKRMPLDVRAWTCGECGIAHDRDLNAAKNIRAAGLAVLASGGSGRPVPACAGSGGSR